MSWEIWRVQYLYYTYYTPESFAALYNTIYMGLLYNTGRVTEWPSIILVGFWSIPCTISISFNHASLNVAYLLCTMYHNSVAPNCVESLIDMWVGEDAISMGAVGKCVCMCWGCMRNLYMWYVDGMKIRRMWGEWWKLSYKLKFELCHDILRCSKHSFYIITGFHWVDHWAAGYIQKMKQNHGMGNAWQSPCKLQNVLFFVNRPLKPNKSKSKHWTT